jgi:putative membrane protein
MKTKKLTGVAACAVVLLIFAGCGREEGQSAYEGSTASPAVAPAPSTQDNDAPPSTKSGENVAESTTTETAASGSSTASTAMLNAVDRDFAARAFSTSIAIVQAGRLAAEKTLDEDVRQFAQEMVKDHTASNEELTKIAQAKKLELPMAPQASFKDALQQLTTTTGPQHDRFYMERFGASAHRDALELYEREIREGEDADLKRYAERLVPTLRQHLQRAEKVQQGIETIR